MHNFSKVWGKTRTERRVLHRWCARGIGTGLHGGGMGRWWFPLFGSAEARRLGTHCFFGLVWFGLGWLGWVGLMEARWGDRWVQCSAVQCGVSVREDSEGGVLKVEESKNLVEN